jgi:hypothetical protein
LGSHDYLSQYTEMIMIQVEIIVLDISVQELPTNFTEQIETAPDQLDVIAVNNNGALSVARVIGNES